jgi:hypothetical protein
LARAETLVNRPNRAFLKEFPAGSAIIIHHTGWTATASGEITANYPGLTSSLNNGLVNPMRTAMVTEPVMRLYAGVRLGTACRIRPNDQVEVIYQGKTATVTARENVKAFGFSSRFDTELKTLSLDNVCKSD